MKYVLTCGNPDCELHGVHFSIGKYTMKFDKNLKKVVPNLIGQPVLCSKCGSELVFKEVENNIPEFNVGVFKGLPDDKKKEILRQRFDKDLKRGAADEKEHRKRKAMEKLVGYN